MALRYVWRGGHGIAGLKAQEVGEYLEELRRTVGLTPENIVEDARRESSLLHSVFEWDDAKAAHEHRLQQSRNIVQVVLREPEANEPEVRAFVHINDGESRRYESVERALTDTDMRALVLGAALRRFQSLRAQYAHMADLAQVFAALDAVALGAGKPK